MKVGLVGKMNERPVRETIAALDDRCEPDAQRRAQVCGAKAVEPNDGVELEPRRAASRRDSRTHRFVRERAAVAIAAERIDRPFSRRRKVQLVILAAPARRDERLEAGM